MRDILEDIYYGRLAMHEQTFKRGSKYAEVLSMVTNLEENLISLLPPEHHYTIKDYSTACAELASISECDVFIKGFQAGAQVMLAVLQPEDFVLKSIGSKDEKTE